MKILHIGCCVYKDRESSIARAFRKVGDYMEIALDNGFQSKAVSIASIYKPDFVFLQLQNDIMRPEDVSKIKLNSGFVINWTGDVRQPLPEWFVKMAEVVDCTGFTNNFDIEVLRKKGFRAEFIQQGYDETIYYPSNQHNDIDIVFMANNYNRQFPLSADREKLAIQLKGRYGRRFKLYGSGWKIADGNVNHSQEEEAAIYRRSKIAINLSHFNLERYSSDRMTRIMGSGALCLTHRYKGLEIDFKDGHDVIGWDSYSELVEKIDYYLEHPSEAQKIAANGANEVKKFTFDNMVKELLKL